jgi:hypothetical protein
VTLVLDVLIYIRKVEKTTTKGKRFLRQFSQEGVAVTLKRFRAWLSAFTWQAV